MPINQPIISDNQADNSWKLEATNLINNTEARVNTLASTTAISSPGTTLRFAQSDNTLQIRGDVTFDYTPTFTDTNTTYTLSTDTINRSVQLTELGTGTLAGSAPLDALGYARTAINNTFTTTGNSFGPGGNEQVALTVNGRVNATIGYDLDANNPQAPLAWRNGNLFVNAITTNGNEWRFQSFGANRSADFYNGATRLATVQSNGDVELHRPGRGIILTSANGTQYRLSVLNDGTVATNAV